MGMFQSLLAVDLKFPVHFITFWKQAYGQGTESQIMNLQWKKKVPRNVNYN